MASTDWKGYLIKFGKVEVPNSYIEMTEDNQSQPNQREEISAERDDYTRELKRVTAPGHITKLRYVFRSMTLKQRRALRNVMKSGLVNAEQRKYNVTYWNDEHLRYEKGEFYIPDIVYSIKSVSKSDIVYNKIEMTMISYKTTEECEG